MGIVICDVLLEAFKYGATQGADPKNLCASYQPAVEYVRYLCGFEPLARLQLPSLTRYIPGTSTLQ